MGFIIKYRPFFSVWMKEDNESLNGFQFFPTYKCRQQLSNYNLVFRNRAGGFEVFRSETPFIEIKGQVRLTFGFTIPDGGLFEKYGLTSAAAYQPELYFDNFAPADNPPILTGDDTVLVADGSHVSAADTCLITRPTFEVIDRRSTAIPSKYYFYKEDYPSVKQTNKVYNDPNLDYAVTTINSVDKGAQYFSKSGSYTLKADLSSVPDRRMYLNDELGRKSVQGVVDIYWKDSQRSISDSDGQTYNIKFKRK